MHLRPATPDDALALGSFGRHAFIAAFGHCYANADLDPFLEKVYGEAGVRGDLADPLIRVELAVDERGIAGFCKMKLSAGWPGHARGRNPVQLMQLYVDPARTGQAIGARLMDWALAAARGHGADEIQLSVWSENFGGHRFYERYGFAKVADIDFWVTNHRDEEFLYALRL
jgi:ribosomal protein S18 acetylase RimI-like enzyme